MKLTKLSQTMDFMNCTDQYVGRRRVEGGDWIIVHDCADAGRYVEVRIAIEDVSGTVYRVMVIVVVVNCAPVRHVGRYWCVRLNPGRTGAIAVVTALRRAGGFCGHDWWRNELFCR